MTISVIIPVYNGANFIACALQSVFNQTKPVLEVILVDDGSTDDLDSAIAPFDKPINLIRQKNSGQASARNRGIESAKGELIAFLDADDYWTTDHLDLLYTHLQNDPTLDYAIGRVSNFLDGDRVAKQDLERVEKRDGLAGFVPGAGLFHNMCFKKIGVFNEDYRIAEVIDWSARALDGNLKYIVLDRVTLMRRIHGDNNGLKRKADQGEYLRALRASIKRRSKSN